MTQLERGEDSHLAFDVFFVQLLVHSVHLNLAAVVVVVNHVGAELRGGLSRAVRRLSVPKALRVFISTFWGIRNKDKARYIDTAGGETAIGGVDTDNNNCTSPTTSPAPATFPSASNSPSNIPAVAPDAGGVVSKVPRLPSPTCRRGNNETFRVGHNGHFYNV